MSCRTQKNNQAWQKIGGNEENLVIILMAAFGTQNAHSGVGDSNM